MTDWGIFWDIVESYDSLPIYYITLDSLEKKLKNTTNRKKKIEIQEEINTLNNYIKLLEESVEKVEKYSSSL